jgi:hypothetical protein
MEAQEPGIRHTIGAVKDSQDSLASGVSCLQAIIAAVSTR